MSQSYYVHPRPPYQDEERLNPWVLRLLLLGFTGFILLIFSLVAALAGYQFMTQDQIHAGLAPIYGVQISGMTRSEAVLALSQQNTYSDQARFTFTYQSQNWAFSGQEIGLTFDSAATVEEAFQVGREGTLAQNMLKQWRVWREGYQVAPVISYNRSQAEAQLQALAQNYINQPVQDATLTLQSGQIRTTGSQVGLEVDIPATLAALEQAITTLQTESQIPLVVKEQAPTLADAEAAGQRATLALDPRGVTFFIPAELGADAGPWTAQPDSIENMLRIERLDNPDGTAAYDVYVTLDQARDFLTGLSEELSRPAQDSRFIFNDQTKQLEVIESSVNGRSLNIEATLAGFSSAVFSSDNRMVGLVFDEVVPTVNNNASAAELGINELVYEATTYYLGSPSSRRANIQVAAAKFHGIVIPPGGEFSFNEWLGEVDLGEGYEEALIIVGGQTITGVGGGICQVSTTVFQAAFYSGFPILERYPHGYRVAYYETGEGVGMDAAVYSPTVDFRFKNDSPHHLLIETYVRPANNTISVRFYSTDMGRRVVKEGPIIKNERPAPPPVYRADASLNSGEVLQTDYAVAGSEVFVYRTVYQGDEIIVDREEFYSNYTPWPSQFNVAPDDPRLTTQN
jgi:vancomycin resistance protein YoaR